MPALAITLDPGEQLVSHTGELSWMSQSIQLKTTTNSGGNQGLFGAVKRVMAAAACF